MINVSVGDLTISGQVNHTLKWEEYLNDYNNKYPTAQRDYGVFWAGERFMLSANTTVTGTATQADRVTVQMGTTLVDLTPSNSSHTNWIGEMWEESFENLTDGNKTFTFTSYWNNGTVSTDPVIVQISGNTYDYLRTHRIQ